MKQQRGHQTFRRPIILFNYICVDYLTLCPYDVITIGFLSRVSVDRVGRSNLLGIQPLQR
jgi:hypothetical protein